MKKASPPNPLDYGAKKSRNSEAEVLFILHKSTYIHGNVLLGI